MHPSIYFTLVVAATHFAGIESFNLGRDVSDANTWKKENPVVSEVLEGRLVTNREAQKIFDGPMFRQVVEQNGFSNEILGSQIANFLASTQKPPVLPEELADDSRKSTAAGRPLVGNLDDISFEVRDVVPVNQVIPAGGQVSTPANGFRHLKESDERDEDDTSDEVRSSLSARGSISLDATDFHNRPDGGVLIQPESEDWFLVRQYMDEFRGADGEELAKEYFWQPVKSRKGLDSESEEDDSNESS